MNAAQYLDAIKAKTGIGSDYALAALLEVPRQYVSRWRDGQFWPDAYACTRIAIALELDPATVIADIQSQAETNPRRAEFWRSFLSRARTLAAVLCTLAWTCSAICGADTAGAPRGVRRARLAA